ncbi:MAG: hypothetical protein ABL958_04200 [Bdellovibrionia bacterium]
MEKSMILFQFVLFVIGLGVVFYGRQWDSIMLFTVGVFVMTSGVLFSFYYVPGSH